MVYLKPEIVIISTVYHNWCKEKFSFSLEEVLFEIDKIEAESKYAILPLYSSSSLRAYLNRHSDIFLFDKEYLLDNQALYLSVDEAQDPLCAGRRLLEVLDAATNYPKPVFRALGLFDILSSYAEVYS